MSETPSDDELRAIYNSPYKVGAPNRRNGFRALFLAGRVSSAPSREAIAEAIFFQIEFKVTHEMWKEFVEAGIADIYFAAADAVVALMKENQGDKG